MVQTSHEILVDVALLPSVSMKILFSHLLNTKKRFVEVGLFNVSN